MKKKIARARKRRRNPALIDMIEKLKGSLKETGGPSGLDVLLEERRREFEQEEEEIRRWRGTERRSGRPRATRTGM